MAVSGKTAAPIEAPYFLDSDKPPNMATVTKAQADRLHALIEAFGLDDVLDGTAAASQLLIAQPGDVARFRAMSGDVSMDGEGVTQVGNNKLATGMYQDGSVTSRKLRPTIQSIGPSADLTGLTQAGGLKDVPGTSITVAPEVASTVVVFATFQWSIVCGGSVGAAAILGRFYIDEAILEPRAEQTVLAQSSGTAAISNTTMIFMVKTLSAASHTIKLQASVSDGGTGMGAGSVFKASTRLAVVTFAS